MAQLEEKVEVVCIDEKAEDVCVVDFTGHWKLRTSDNLDGFLKDEGWGYLS